MALKKKQDKNNEKKTQFLSWMTTLWYEMDLPQLSITNKT